MRKYFNVFKCENLPYIFVVMPLVIIGTDLFLTKLFNYASNNRQFFSSVVVEIIGSFLGAFFALGIFALEMRRANRKEILKTKKDIDDLFIYCKYQLINAIEWTTSQKKLLIEYCEKLNNNKETIPNLHVDPDQSFSRLYDLFGKIEFYHSYLTKFDSTQEYINKFSKMTDSIDYFYNVRNQLLEMRSQAINNFNNRVYKLKDKINEELDILTDYTAKYSNTNLDEFAEIIFDHVKLKSEIDGNSMISYIDKIFNPLKQILGEKYEHIDGVRDVILRINRINLEYRELTNNLELHKQDYEKVIEYFTAMKAKLAVNSVDILKLY